MQVMGTTLPNLPSFCTPVPQVTTQTPQNKKKTMELGTSQFQEDTYLTLWSQWHEGPCPTSSSFSPGSLTHLSRGSCRGLPASAIPVHTSPYSVRQGQNLKRRMNITRSKPIHVHLYIYTNPYKYIYIYLYMDMFIYDVQPFHQRIFLATRTPLPSWSTSLIHCTNSSSAGHCPRHRMAVPSSLVEMEPPPSRSSEKTEICR